MGKNIAETPGRMAAAAEGGDYGTFGSEAMNLAMLARAGAQAPRAMLGAAELVGNPLVRRLGALGAPGRALRASIRNAQLRWMQRRAAKLAGVDENIYGRPKKLEYVESLGKDTYAAYTPGNADTILVSELTFRPFGPIGGYQGGMMLAKIRWEVGNLLRGNYTFRVLVHENFHRFQATSFNPEYLQWRGTPYPIDPREFLTSGCPASWGVGAWDFEMNVPAGPIATLIGLVPGLQRAAFGSNP